MKPIRSFDVFDTCLVRTIAVPSGVFYNVARKAFTLLAIPFSHASAEDFVAARINAERLARERSKREEITLEEIWQVLTPAMGWPNEPALAESELEAEEELLVPVRSIHQEIQAARREGSRIIFLSDMYLPGEFIRRQLLKHGCAQAGDGIYVSADIGKTKAGGNLFRHVLTQEKVAASDIRHTGDHRQSDYAVPRKLGIRATLFSEAGLTHAETSVLHGSHDSRAGLRIAGAMRAYRLGGGAEEQREIRQLAAQFIGPFLLGFAAWVLQRAREDGVKRLYFLSRDCQLAWKVAGELSPQFGGIDCRYLYVSRQALFLPSAKAVSPEEMPWMKRSFEEPTLDRLLAKVELKYSDVEPRLKKLAGRDGAAYRLRTEEDWNSFWNCLNEEPVRSRLKELIAARAESARSYFGSAGLLEDSSWAVVDLGWYLTCQQTLWKILRQANWPGQISGYYAELSQGRIPGKESGRAQALFYQTAPDHPRKGATPMTNATLLEHVLGCADHPTVHHYEKVDGVARPCFAKTMDQASLEFSRNVHEAVLGFVRRNKALAEDFSGTAHCRSLLKSLLTSFVYFPMKEEAEALREISAAGDQNNLGALPIVRPLGVLGALLPLLPRREPFGELWNRRACVWPEGSAASTPAGIKRLEKVAGEIAGLRSGIRRLIRK